MSYPIVVARPIDVPVNISIIRAYNAQQTSIAVTLNSYLVLSASLTHSSIADKGVCSRLYVDHHWLALHRQQETEPAVEVSGLLEAHDGVHKRVLRGKDVSEG